MFRIYECEARKDIWDDMEKRILSICTHTFSHFLEIAKDPREVWSPLVALIIKEILSLPDDRVSAFILSVSLDIGPVCYPCDRPLRSHLRADYYQS